MPFFLYNPKLNKSIVNGNCLGPAEKLRIKIFRCFAPYMTSGVNVVSTKIARLCRLKMQYLENLVEPKE